MYSHQVRVRYAETDKMGVAHHSSYWLWFEEARVEFFNNYNINYVEIEKMGFALPVSESFCKYKSPAYFNDVLIIQIIVAKIGLASIKLEYTILNDKNQIVATAYTLHPVINSQGKIVKIPDFLKNLLKKI